jgi:serine/threonine protein kinase
MLDYTGLQLGNYRLVRLIGEGSFAQVYLGEHIYLSTQAAIKVLHTQLVDDLDVFRTEARTIARLIHPNIVRVLDFGVEDKTPYLVLDYAPGGTLRQRHPEGSLLPVSIAVAYVKQIAAALQYAHDEKLVHRDVKPENMLLGRRNEVLLSDFGVALMVQTFSFQSLQDVAGTLPYMAPEQIQGKPRPASDQYALGIIVYEWLTGQRPFSGSPAEMISKHLIATPLPLRDKVPMLAPAVERVVMTTLEKDPEKRFESIQAFALALEMASQPGASVAVAGSVPAKIDEHDFTVPAFARPVSAPVNEVASRRSVAAPPAGAGQQARPAGTIICSYRGHSHTIRSLSWWFDGRRIVSASDDKTTHVWDAMTGRRIPLYRDVSEAVYAAVGAPDGSRLATVGVDALIRVWDIATNRVLATYAGHRRSVVRAIAWSPLQQLLASAATDGTVHVWDATTGQPLTIYRGHAGNVNALAWLPKAESPSPRRASLIVSGGDDASVQTWEAYTGNRLSLYRSQPAPITSVAWSPNTYPVPLEPGQPVSMNYTSRVACGRVDGLVQMWDTSTEREVLHYRYIAPLTVVAWSPEGKRFAYASENNTVEVWDTVTNFKLLTFSHAAPVRVMAWSPNGKYIASGSEDAIIQVWVAP